MWSCVTLYNRPQVCFTPDLQPEWLLALICIFIGCICITTTVILLASSHFDRNVIPYARWVGFAASKYMMLLNFSYAAYKHFRSIQNLSPSILIWNWSKWPKRFIIYISWKTSTAGLRPVLFISRLWNINTINFQKTVVDTFSGILHTTSYIKHKKISVPFTLV